MPHDVVTTWYHGSPFALTSLRPGSTITPDRHLAMVFSHKPTVVCMEDDGSIRHNGMAPGYLYVVDEEVGPEDVYPHPRSSMAQGLEWLTARELAVRLVAPTAIVEEERLTEEDIRRLLDGQAR